MKYKGMEKKEEGKFITRYDLQYETEDGLDKTYEVISRNPDMKTTADVSNTGIDAVVLIIQDETHEHILLDREFRLAVNRWVYNFPAGLIDEGEQPDESAKRELFEETGLELVSIEDHIGPSYSAVGFSNEINVCVIGTARGEFKKSTSTYEEIVPGWYTREQIRDLLKTERFTARTQAYCYLWSRQKV